MHLIIGLLEMKILNWRTSLYFQYKDQATTDTSEDIPSINQWIIYIVIYIQWKNTEMYFWDFIKQESHWYFWKH